MHIRKALLGFFLIFIFNSPAFAGGGTTGAYSSRLRADANCSTVLRLFLPTAAEIQVELHRDKIETAFETRPHHVATTGESAVFQVRDENGDPLSAIKIPKDEEAKVGAEDRYRTEMWVHERLTKKLGRRKADNYVLPIEEVRKLDDDTPVLVSRWIDGGTLSDHLSDFGGPDTNPAVTLQTFVRLAAAELYLHENKIAHGDFKPSNILLDYVSRNVPQRNTEGSVKLKKLPRFLMTDGSLATQPGEPQLGGTLLYMKSSSNDSTNKDGSIDLAEFFRASEKRDDDAMGVIFRDLALGENSSRAVKVGTPLAVGNETTRSQGHHAVGDNTFRLTSASPPDISRIGPEHLTEDATVLGITILHLNVSPYSILGKDGLSPIVSLLAHWHDYVSPKKPAELYERGDMARERLHWAWKGLRAERRFAAGDKGARDRWIKEFSRHFFSDRTPEEMAAVIHDAAELRELVGDSFKKNRLGIRDRGRSFYSSLLKELERLDQLDKEARDRAVALAARAKEIQEDETKVSNPPAPSTASTGSYNPPAISDSATVKSRR